MITEIIQTFNRLIANVSSLILNFYRKNLDIYINFIRLIINLLTFNPSLISLILIFLELLLFSNANLTIYRPNQKVIILFYHIFYSALLLFLPVLFFYLVSLRTSMEICNKCAMSFCLYRYFLI